MFSGTISFLIIVLASTYRLLIVVAGCLGLLDCQRLIPLGNLKSK